MVLGPVPAYLSMSIILTVQCLLFGDGGLRAAVLGTTAPAAVTSGLLRLFASAYPDGTKLVTVHDPIPCTGKVIPREILPAA